jgi:uncharacterized protein YaaW (UPF0174 family)
LPRPEKPVAQPQSENLSAQRKLRSLNQPAQKRATPLHKKLPVKVQLLEQSQRMHQALPDQLLQGQLLAVTQMLMPLQFLKKRRVFQIAQNFVQSVIKNKLHQSHDQLRHLRNAKHVSSDHNVPTLVQKSL